MLLAKRLRLGQINSGSGDGSITGWDLDEATLLTDLSLPKNGQSVTLSSDGTFLYVGSGRYYIYQYMLSVAWDISTATLSNTIDLFSQGYEEFPNGLYISPDGTRFFQLGADKDSVEHFSLATTWDITTASFVQEFYIGSKDIVPSGLHISDDGLHLYTSSFIYDCVYQWTMTTPWDLSTASFVYKFDLSGHVIDNPHDIHFSPDGTKMLLSESTTITKYELSTAWDISSAVFAQEKAGDFGNGLFVSADGVNLFAANSGSSKLYHWVMQ
jgi:DNA-binding beta-propeller fold protein YncE